MTVIFPRIHALLNISAIREIRRDILHVLFAQFCIIILYRTPIRFLGTYEVMAESTANTATRNILTHFFAAFFMTLIFMQE